MIRQDFYAVDSGWFAILLQPRNVLWKSLLDGLFFLFAHLEMHLLMPFSSPIFTESTLLSEWMVDQRDEDRLRTNGFGCKRTWTANWQPRGIQVLRSQKKKKNVFYFILQNVEGLWHSARESGREREKKNCWFDMEMKRWTRAWIAQVVNNLVVVNIKSIKLWMPGGWTWKERKKVRERKEEIESKMACLWYKTTGYKRKTREKKCWGAAAAARRKSTELFSL